MSEPFALPPVEVVDALEPTDLALLAQGLADRLARVAARLSAATGLSPRAGRRRGCAARLEDAVTVGEAARIAHVSPATVRDWLYKRKLASVKIGGRVCIRRADLEALVTVRPARVRTLDGQ